MSEGPVNSPEIPRLPRVLEPGYNYASVTDKIASIVLTRPVSLRLAQRIWYRIYVDDGASRFDRLAGHERRRHLGHQHSHWLGLCDRQFRLVDRYRPCGHADFRDSFPAQPAVADFDQPFRRSDDAIRRGLRRRFPGHSRGPSVDGVLHVPVPEHDGDLAAIPQPAHLGRVRGFNVRHGFRIVLVCRADS